jgi:hypothetical protein
MGLLLRLCLLRWFKWRWVDDGMVGWGDVMGIVHREMARG